MHGGRTAIVSYASNGASLNNVVDFCAKRSVVMRQNKLVVRVGRLAKVGAFGIERFRIEF